MDMEVAKLRGIHEGLVEEYFDPGASGAQFLVIDHDWLSISWCTYRHGLIKQIEDKEIVQLLLKAVKGGTHLKNTQLLT